MLIDWFTVVAQVVNFLLLVWLLKRFLYRPILDAIDAREKRIAAQMQAGEEKVAEAARQRDDYLQRGEALERQRASLLEQAAQEAAAERLRLVEEARRDAAALRARLEQSVSNERQELLGEVTAHAGREVFAIARKALTDLAATDLEQRIAEVFLRRLRALDDAERQRLSASLETSARPATVRSAFDLPAGQKAAIGEVLRQTLGVVGEIRFECVPALVGGIELATDGHKLSWNIADYLAALEGSMGELLERKLPATASQQERDEPA